MTIGHRTALFFFVLFSTAALAQAPGQASAGLAYQGWGLRAGLADDPDTVVFGAHANFGEIIENLRLQPNIEIGVGDDHTTLFLTGAFHYRFAVAGGITPYAGGGPAVGFVNRDRKRGGDDTNFEIGLRAVGGLEWPLRNSRAFFVELQLGIGDVQDAQLVAGWFF